MGWRDVGTLSGGAVNEYSTKVISVLSKESLLQFQESPSVLGLSRSP